jgi:plasmid stabilization system protein ParE
VNLAYVVRPRADRDIDDVADYRAEPASLEIALLFLAEVYEAFGLIATQPEMVRLARPGALC